MRDQAGYFKNNSSRDGNCKIYKGQTKIFFFNINVCVCSWTETELVTVECIVCRNICIINVSTPWLLSNTLSRLREMFSLMKSELFLHILRAERVLIVKHN